MFKKIIFLLYFSSLTTVVLAQPQSKEELQHKQQELMKEIKSLNATLKQIRNSKNKSLANYNLIKRKIAVREEYIHNINKDLRILDDNIYLNTLEINRLKKELDTLKREYAKSLVYAYKNRSNYDYLNFIFSAKTFNDAIKRITYLKSYRQYREQQVANIYKTQDMINHTIAKLNDSKNEKNMVLNDQKNQLTDLEADKKEQNEEVNKLKTQEKDLAAQIRKRESDRKQMQNAIAAIIRREVAEARRKAEEKRKAEEAERIKREKSKNQPASPDVASKPKAKVTRAYSALESTDESRNQSIKFESNKGGLPWPVDAGLVTIHFGNYNVPGTKLTGRSDGIYIAVPIGASVKNVADGEVLAVYDLGGEQAVTVKHGKYFTTYSHLSSVNVNAGATVKPGSVVGRAAENDNGEGEVLFMVTGESGGHLNPESWLSRR